MKPPTPPRIIRFEDYWNSPPPEPSRRLNFWINRFRFGWRPNRRFRCEGYYTAAQLYGVYIYEYVHVISPLLRRLPPIPPPPRRPRVRLVVGPPGMG